MKLSLILFLSLLLTIKNIWASFDIDAFIDYLQEKSYWDIIYNIKIYFNDLVAIDICTKLTNSPNNCELVVRVYMIISQPSLRRCPKNPLERMMQILFGSTEAQIDIKIDESELKNIIKKNCLSKI